MMHEDSSKHCRYLRPVGALFQADLFLAEVFDQIGFTKQVTVWNVRPELLVQTQPAELLIEELGLAAKLTTSSVTQVIDVWSSPRELSLAVEHVEGLSLAKALLQAAEKGERLPIDAVLSIILDAVRALEFAHDTQPSRGPVVHGDLRPENVLVSPDGAVKLTGFGFGRFLQSLEPRGLYCSWDGWCYQPPERLDTNELDPRADIFSLGLVFYQALTGERPYGIDDQEALIAKLESGVNPLPQHPFAADEVEQVIRRACEPSPEDRYQTASSFSAAIQGFQDSRSTTTMSSTLNRELFGPSYDIVDLIDADEEPTFTTTRSPRTLPVDTIKENEDTDAAFKETDVGAYLELCQLRLARARCSKSLTHRSELRLLLEVGKAASRAMRFDVAEGALQEASQITDRTSAPELELEADILLLQIFARQGKLKDVMELAKDTIPRAEASGDPLLLALAYGAIGEAYQQYGQFGPDLRYIEAAVSFAVESEDPIQLGHVLKLAVLHAAGVGEDEQTRVLLEQIRPIVEENDDPPLTGQFLKSEMVLNIFSRDFEGALSKALLGVRLGRKHSLLQLEVEMLHNAGVASLRLGRTKEAMRYFNTSLRQSQLGRYERLSELNDIYLGFIEAVELDRPEGLDRLRYSIEESSTHGRLVNLLKGHELLGRALLTLGEREQALIHLQEALRYAHASGVRSFVEEASHWLEEAEAHQSSK